MRTAEQLLGAVHRAAASRVVAALAARFRDLDLAEEAYAEALTRAASVWPSAPPGDAPAWLYRTATRVALDQLRRRAVRSRHAAAEAPLLARTQEPEVQGSDFIPDDRLRLIFVCCHPALAEEARVALTLKTVCRLDTAEIAHAFLVPEPTMAQRLVRAKRKIAEAGVPFEIPAPQQWPERLGAILSTIEVAYARAHADGSGQGRRAEFGPEMLELTRLLADLLPDEPDVLALAATVHFAEARRPARIDFAGNIVPLSEQDPKRWNGGLIAAGDRWLQQAFTLAPAGVRQLQAGIHAAWCRRRSLVEAPPWDKVLALYNALIRLRDDPFIRLNRLVALAEVEGWAVALAEYERLDRERLAAYLPFHATGADLLRRAGRLGDARAAYQRALALDPAPAEKVWLTRRMAGCG